MAIELTHSREPLNEEDIAKLEILLGISLPIPYKNFLLSHNGGHPKLAGFYIQNNPSDNHGLIDYFLCIKEKDIYNLLTWIKRYKNRIPSDLIPIAVDPGGNLVCLTVTGNNIGKIYFWDHEEEADEGETPGYANIYPIANSFDEFVGSLIAL